MTRFSLEPGCTTFSWANSFACAQVSLLAYDDNAARVEATAREWGFENVVRLSKEPNFGIILYNNQNLMVAFRGTNQLANWRTNLNVLFKRSPLGFVHRGFMKATESFWPDLPQRIAALRDNDQSIWVSGHSLGGALALLASVKLSIENKLPVSGLYTFGQPAVGTSSFCSRFKRQCPFHLNRFVNNVDAVSDAPILFLEQVGDVRYFDTFGNLFETGPPWRVSLLDHIRAPRKDGGLSDLLAHSMKRYVALLGERLQPELRGEARS